MQLEAKKYLYDIQQAAQQIADFTADKRFEDYQGNPILRAAVERPFEIIGEAIVRLIRLDAAIAARITEYRRIVSFRNILIHGYEQVDDRVVWDIVETKLPLLRREIEELLTES
jgi:uncharacterized protein with HEPN domain